VTDKAQRPYWRRSPLWDHEAEIRRRIAEGQSYAQIVRCLSLPVGARRLGQFCCEQLSIHSLRPSRHDRADKKSAAPGPAAPTVPASPAPAGAQMPKAKPISDLIAHDEAAQRAELARFFKPKSEA